MCTCMNPHESAEPCTVGLENLVHCDIKAGPEKPGHASKNSIDPRTMVNLREQQKAGEG